MGESSETPANGWQHLPDTWGSEALGDPGPRLRVLRLRSQAWGSRDKPPHCTLSEFPVYPTHERNNERHRATVFLGDWSSLEQKLVLILSLPMRKPMKIWSMTFQGHIAGKKRTWASDFPVMNSYQVHITGMETCPAISGTDTACGRPPRMCTQGVRPPRGLPPPNTV